MLLDKSRIEIKLGPYGVAPVTALADPSLLPRVQDYRRQLSSRMVPLDRDDIAKKVLATEYHVSRKVDGEFTVLVFRDGEILTLNPGGTVRVGMPWQEEAARLLTEAGVKEALVAGELYADCSAKGRRPRVHDVTTVARQPKSAADVARLRFAVFDLISLNGDSPSGPFAQTWQTITQIFGSGKLAHPVEAKPAKDADSVEKIFHRWVEEEGAEGIVVRSDTAGLFKIKPRYTLDAAVLGFSESLDDRQGLVHDLLLGVVRRDGTIQVLSRVGGGFSEDERREMFSDLKDMAVDSEYAEVNADHVAYQMVRPDWVVEISCLDVISQTTRGGPINRMVLDWHEANGSSRYNVVRRLPLATVISPQFVRRREDKRVQPDDVRIKQVTDLVEVPLADRDARQLTLPPSKMLRREVYTKAAKGETMVRKFVMWKTNKEAHSDDFPAYVVHFTDFSPNRKAPLAREIRVSSSLDQIQLLYDGFKADHIKKGWEPYTIAAPMEKSVKKSREAAATATAQQGVGAPKKKAAKKKTVAKKPKKAAKTKMAGSERTNGKDKKKTG